MALELRAVRRPGRLSSGALLRVRLALGLELLPGGGNLLALRLELLFCARLMCGKRLPLGVQDCALGRERLPDGLELLRSGLAFGGNVAAHRSDGRPNILDEGAHQRVHALHGGHQRVGTRHRRCQCGLRLRRRRGHRRRGRARAAARGRHSPPPALRRAPGLAGGWRASARASARGGEGGGRERGPARPRAPSGPCALPACGGAPACTFQMRFNSENSTDANTRSGNWLPTGEPKRLHHIERAQRPAAERVRGSVGWRRWRPRWGASACPNQPHARACARARERERMVRPPAGAAARVREALRAFAR